MDVSEILAEAATEEWRSFYLEDEVKSAVVVEPHEYRKIQEFLGEGSDPTETDNYIVSFEDAHGGEGKGSRMYWVYKIFNRSTEETAYAMIDTHYDSWNGIDWDYASIARVYPKEVVKTVWRNNP